jgi:hypothetical protein
MLRPGRSEVGKVSPLDTRTHGGQVVEDPLEKKNARVFMPFLQGDRRQTPAPVIEHTPTFRNYSDSSLKRAIPQRGRPTHTGGIRASGNQRAVTSCERPPQEKVGSGMPVFRKEGL